MPGSRTLSRLDPESSAPANHARATDQPEPDRPFTEPWQAQVFALTVHLNEQGLFDWSEWAEYLSAELNRPDAAADGSDYYQHWASALQALLAAKGMAAPEIVDRVAAAWERAATATPHGQPIELANDPLA